MNDKLAKILRLLFLKSEVEKVRLLVDENIIEELLMAVGGEESKSDGFAEVKKAVEELSERMRKMRSKA